jgi:hypothetical protein
VDVVLIPILDAVMIPTFRFGLPDNPKEVVAKETDEIPVRFAPEPLKLDAVTTPDAFRLVALIVPTVMFGVPESPVAVVAVPVSAPTKVVAVATPIF